MDDGLDLDAMRPAHIGTARWEEAWLRAHRQIDPMLRVRVRRVFGDDAADVDDVLQDVWEKAARGFGRFRGDSPLSLWLWSITRNTLRDKLNSPKARAEEVPLDERATRWADDAVLLPHATDHPLGPPFATETEDDLVEAIDRAEDWRRLQEAARAVLTPSALRLWELYCLHRSNKELMSVYGGTARSLEKKMSLIRERVRNAYYAANPGRHCRMERSP